MDAGRKGQPPVEAWPRRLLAMMMACLESRATWFMSLDQTMYLMKGVLRSATAVLCCTSNRVTCTAHKPHLSPAARPL